jgi:uncharacterized membrane protein
MSLRIESSVVPWLIVAVAPALALTAGGCGDEFESCEARRMCPGGGKAGAAGSGGEAGSAGAAVGGGGNAGTGGAGSGTGGESRGGTSGTSGAGGMSGEGDDGGEPGSGGTAGGVDAGGTAGKGGSESNSGSGGEGGDAVEPPDPCESVTCEHGMCANVDGGGTCECESGFTGSRCELPTFEWIEFLPGHDTGSNYIMSEDGTVLGRSCQSSNCSATVWFRWTHEAGTSAIGGSESVEIYGTNRDASVVVGQFSSPSRAFRWTEASGFVSLGVLPGGDASSMSSASDVSSDGSVVVGSSDYQPFRWTSGTGMVKLGMPTGAPSDSIASPRAVSNDGSIIAGNLNASMSNLVRWTETDEVEWIEPARKAEVTGISADGEVIVGNADFAGVSEAFRWTRPGGIVSLGRPAPCSRGAYAWGTSGDGRVVAVSCLSSDQSYLWDVDNGFRSIQHVLESIGADTSAAGSTTVRSLSFDGSTIVGTASGSRRPWIARLPLVGD